MAEEKGSIRWCFPKEKQIVDSILCMWKDFDLILKILELKLFLYSPFPSLLVAFSVPLGGVWSHFKPFLRLWMGGADFWHNLFSSVLRSAVFLLQTFHSMLSFCYIPPGKEQRVRSISSSSSTCALPRDSTACPVRRHTSSGMLVFSIHLKNIDMFSPHQVSARVRQIRRLGFCLAGLVFTKGPNSHWTVKVPWVA